MEGPLLPRDLRQGGELKPAQSMTPRPGTGMAAALAAAMSVASMSPASAAPCVQYEPVVVTVTGKILAREDYGPPGYGEDRAHDAKERHLYIALDSPLCVDAGQDPDNRREANVKLMEMVYGDYRFQKKWLGSHVSVTGTLFHAFSGHHHTRVLITATETHVLLAAPR